MTQLVPRSALRLGRPGGEGLSRWHWGPEGSRQRVVKVAVIDTEGGRVARVFGLEGKSIQLLEERAGVTSQQWSRRSGFVAFEDGERWELANGGCGCGSPIKKFDPLRVQS